MSAGIGFIRLTDLEWQALKAFGEDGTLNLPYAAMQHVCNRAETTKVFRSLCFKGLIVIGTPYKLTNAGRRIINK